ncbi:hypothetical protein HYPSUDRAFT_196676 [Hypholoma sublateritium FD-334 SS-4]|uniref:Uncharacterized protein n=1 Tax=Hypholoma sublateritium (strain FD-334 SS-4) TaxID=945553 RepID=A0A0D2MYX4_HYPSF|nr:hypothetical protein HYPSUDRAFT_196676 [Hypholoma sublateritium FD-334 SS-4]
MAVPADFTILNITGKFTMNKALSDPRIDTILQLQGVGWITRRVIALGVNLFVKHYKDDAGVEHIDIDQTITGGIPGTREESVLWWKEVEIEDNVFGSVIGKARRVKADEIDSPFLRDGWTEDTYAHELIQDYAKSNTPKNPRSWTANQTWGIETINRERRYARHIKFTGPKGENIEAKLVYDYLGPL